MSETRWTPGPWQVDAEYKDDVRDVTGVNLVAQAYVVPVHRGGGHVRRANACLIAAAPELYEALAEFMDIWNSSDSRSASKQAQARRAAMWTKANAAIAKARGEA